MTSERGAEVDPMEISLSGSSGLGNAFFDNAKRMLETELEHPTVCTIQALCLMAKREMFCGRGLRGGLYFSQCVFEDIQRQAASLMNMYAYPGRAVWSWI